jgi:hypothetical protein
MGTTTNKIGATGNPDVDGLLSGFAWTGGSITYSFPSSPTAYPAGYGVGEPSDGFSPLSAAEQSLVKNIMSEVASFTDLKITYAGTGSADIMLAHSSDANPSAYTYYPDGSIEGGDVWFGTSYNYGAPRAGDYSWLTHIHEIGHALGLKHSFEMGGVANEAVPSDHDSLEYTVMSYRSYAGGNLLGYTNEQYGYPTTYMMDDILALQTLYGADYTANGSNNVYTWSPTTGQEFINGVAQALPGADRVFMTVWDGGGNATYNFSNYSTDMTINLNPGAYSVLSTHQLAYLGNGFYAHGNVYNAYLFDNDPRSYIANAILGSGNDSVIGNPANNVLTAGAGQDTLEGGGGHDTLIAGSGTDTFVFHPQDGVSTIVGFNASHGDTVILGGIAGISSYSDVLAHATQVGSDAVLNFGTNEEVIFHNTSLSSLTSTDFQFQAAAPPQQITNMTLLDGVETAVINDTYADATIQVGPSGVTVTTTNGFDGITNAERLEFSDAVVAFDVNGAAGFAYRLYQAAFDRTPDVAGLSWNVHLLDARLTETQMSAAFVASAEFQNTYGPNQTNAQFVTALYSNILHRAPDPGGYSGWLALMNSGQESRANVLIGFSESTENHNAVDPKIVTGIMLDPHYLS